MIGGAQWIRTPDPLLAKHLLDFDVASENVRELLRTAYSRDRAIARTPAL